MTRRKPQAPGTAKEHKGQGTPTININDRQPAQVTDQAPGTIERAALLDSNDSCVLIPDPKDSRVLTRL